MKYAQSTEAPPLAEVSVGGKNRQVRLLVKLSDDFTNPIRLSALMLLAREDKKSLRELVEAVGAPQPQASVHLPCLGWCGYVRARRDGGKLLLHSDEQVPGVLRLAEVILADNLEHVEACGVTKGC